MKTQFTAFNAKLFGLKLFGKGCRFGIKISSRKQDGTYTNGLFLNCKHNEMLNPDVFYTIEGFLGDNEYNGNNTLEFIVMSAVPCDMPVQAKQPYQAPTPQYEKKMPENNLPSIDIGSDEIPFAPIGLQYKALLLLC